MKEFWLQQPDTGRKRAHRIFCGSLSVALVIVLAAMQLARIRCDLDLFAQDGLPARMVATLLCLSRGMLGVCGRFVGCVGCDVLIVVCGF